MRRRLARKAGTSSASLSDDELHMRPTASAHSAQSVGENTPTDVLEVWFSGCHSGQRPPAPRI